MALFEELKKEVDLARTKLAVFSLIVPAYCCSFWKLSPPLDSLWRQLEGALADWGQSQGVEWSSCRWQTRFTRGS